MDSSTANATLAFQNIHILHDQDLVEWLAREGDDDCAIVDVGDDFVESLQDVARLLGRSHLCEGVEFGCGNLHTLDGQIWVFGQWGANAFLGCGCWELSDQQSCEVSNFNKTIKKSLLSEGETPTMAYPFASIASDSCRDVPHLKQLVRRLKLFMVH